MGLAASGAKALGAASLFLGTEPRNRRELTSLLGVIRACLRRSDVLAAGLRGMAVVNRTSIRSRFTTRIAWADDAAPRCRTGPTRLETKHASDAVLATLAPYGAI